VEIQGAEQLVGMKCKPCEGGVSPCTQEEAELQLEKLDGWQLSHQGLRIKKSWTVKNFMAGLRFFNAIAEVAESDGHHPDLHIAQYRQIEVELWTHAIGGLSENDFILAAKIDQLPIELQTQS
jgi:4a-hydroxytetrahydrobiopterin dehydratase